MMTRFIQNRKGQVAIFIALMFQVLFLFFAMIVNVGLLVHHKINLQNSVDLAAYYGASKQAEVLNAISHVNYQIRQSWKLLVWRQKVLGTAGVDPTNPVFPYAKLNLNSGSLQETFAGISPDSRTSRIFRKPSFCISYAPHEVSGQGNVNNVENTCKNMWEDQTQVTLPSANVLYIPGFFNFGNTVAAAITQAAQQAFTRCADVGGLNYVMGARFIIAHYIDADERAYLMNYLATGLSSQEDNFFELSGDQVKSGLEKTLRKNLTDANNASIQFELYNSLAASSCRNTVGANGANPPQWMVPIQTFPVWRYLDCMNNGDVDSGQITTRSRHLIDSQPPAMLSQISNPDLVTSVNEVRQHIFPRTTLVGFEKDPWCVPYVGVRATARPKIPFMPLSDLEIKAQAYAKPFGGRMGPWYVKDWPQAVAGAAREGYKANAPQPNDMVESVGAVRVNNISGINGIDDDAWAPNIARFAGDTLGFASERVLAFFHSAIQGINTGNAFPPRYLALTPTPPNYPFPVMPAQEHVSLRYYNNVATGYSTNTARDQLTWDVDSNAAPRLRLMEIAAIAPTIYDLSYYSIDPDFYNNYFSVIEQQHIPKRQGWDSQKTLLGDYGWRFDTDRGKRMNIFDQIKIQRDVGSDNALSSDSTMPYVVKQPLHLLNSWAVDSIRDYRNNTNKFGNCFSPSAAEYETPMNPAYPGNCVDGGRVGYSVKLVSKEWLTATDLELGGSGLTGAIRNPPPW